MQIKHMHLAKLWQIWLNSYLEAQMHGSRVYLASLHNIWVQLLQ